MRRFLILLCAAALGLTLLGARPASATPLRLHVSSEPLLSENGDGYWESATVFVSTNADAAHWVLSGLGKTVAEGDVTDEQLQAARVGHPAEITVSSLTTGAPLAAGTYRFSVTATAADQAPLTGATEIHVSTARPLASMTRSATVIFPNDYNDGVAHEIAFRHGLDAATITRGVVRWEVVGPGGVSYGPWNVDPRDPVLRWNGKDHDYDVVAPGVYRVRLTVSDDGMTKSGPLSQPFGVSRGYRVSARQIVTQRAGTTRTATLTRRHARFSVVNGSLRYRRTGNDWRKTSLVRTAHQVRIPAGRIPGTRPALVVRGRWHDADAALEVLTRTGRPRLVSAYDGGGPGYRLFVIPRYLLRADGTVRFRVVWSTNDSTYRTGRVDSIGVRIDKWVWRDLT
ncbi:hypothetical protein [Nocardioides sp. LML1-1-1.1]|uniref:hypothetical protein n=1 Tax=Nocardioides sp. LML1-1-1.1 TaxID=3135248 RepID=UPI00344502FF